MLDKIDDSMILIGTTDI